jgi:hypothetical protein
VIRDKTSDVTSITNLGADRLRFELDEDGLIHICDMLIGQYNDEEMAVLREYCTNARDAHIAAAIAAAERGEEWTPRPIEVTLPIDPYGLPSADKGRFLRIKDYGVGLSVEEIGSVFSRIGKSTKDDSNEQNGMMGIGGKSGLCATFGTFRITAVKDGEKAIVMCGRNEATEPVMDLVSITETDEPNGVEIELPTPKYHKLRRKAAALFQFWPEGSVLVDGVEPEKLKPKVKITDDMWIVDSLSSKGQRSDWIVMADVPYPVQLDGKLADDHSLVIFVPTGAVTIAPSREALRMTPKTKDELARLMAVYDQKVRAAVQDAVTPAKTKAEAAKALVKVRTAFATKGDLGVTWRGHKIPLEFSAPSIRIKDEWEGGILVTEHGKTQKGHHSRQKTIFLGTLMDAVLVHGFTGKSFNSVAKEKLEAWARDQMAKGMIKPKHYVLTADKLATGWTDPKMRVDWEDVKAHARKRNAAGGRGGPHAIAGTYDLWLAGDYKRKFPAADIPQDQPVFWMETDWFTARGYSYYQKHVKSRRTSVQEKYPTATFVELTSNRVNKFCRDFPQARHASAILDEIYVEWKATVKKADLMRLAVEDAHVGHSLRRLDLARVDDPAVKKAIRLANRKLNENLSKERDQIRHVCGRHRVDEDKDMQVKWVNPLDKYPLADTAHLEHTYTYMNAVYAAQESKKS